MTRLAGAKTDTWWLRRHPAVRALTFQPHIRRQDRINWQIRFIEGATSPRTRAFGWRKHSPHPHPS
ncbi:hypothetical protein SCYAM73S_05943 [Streptomyces cyaneofuscatus]